MNEHKYKEPLDPYKIPNDATALRNTTSEQSALAHAEANERMKESLKKLTPQEIQRKIYLDSSKKEPTTFENNRKHPDNEELPPSPEQSEVDPATAAIVASMESGCPFVALIDNGTTVTLHAAKLAEPAILGLMVKFVHQLTTQEIIPKGQNNG